MSHSTTPNPHGSDAHAHDPVAHRAHKRKYLLVFTALIVGTIITVGAYFIHIPVIWLTILLALIIATVKASLVAGWFMHLVTERRMIYAILAFTGFFFLGLMFLTIWALHDMPRAPLP